MVADVVSGPKHNVVADYHKWLDHVIFKDEAVFAENNVRADVGKFADERSWGQAERAEVVELFLSRRVVLRSPYCGKEETPAKLVSRQLRSTQYRSTIESMTREISIINDEGRNSKTALGFKIIGSNLSEFPDAEDE